MKILVVDDMADYANTIKALLGSTGHEVRVFYDPAEALVFILEGGEFDTLLSDIQMPRMTGFQLAEKARQYKPGVGITLMSGNSSYREQVLSQGWRFLPKPFLAQELASCI